MSEEVLRNLSDDELRREQALWQTAMMTSLLNEWRGVAFSLREKVVAEGDRRKANFWKVTLS